MKSIKTKITVLILTCVLLSCFVMVFLNTHNAENVVDNDSAQIMNLLCSKNAGKVDALLYSIEQSVNTLADYARARIESDQLFRTDRDYLEKYLSDVFNVSLSVASNTDEALSVYMRFDPKLTGSPVDGFFWGKTSVDGDFEKLQPTDISKFLPHDQSMNWYYDPINNRAPVWTSPYDNQYFDIKMLSYIVPIYHNGTLIGVIGMDIALDLLTGIVENTRVYQSGYASIISGDSSVIYHRQLDYGVRLTSLDPSLAGVIEVLEHGSNDYSLFSYTWQGVEKRMSVCRLRNGMRLAMTAPAGEIDAEKNTMVLHSMFALAIVASLSVLLTAYVTHRMIRPLLELTSAARKIAGGDLSVALTYYGHDEVGTLSESFRQMADNLRKHIKHINSLAYRDGLTGVKNKLAYSEAVDRLNAQINDGDAQFSIIVIDFNNLKWINDTYGHDFGDMIISSICRIICRVFKQSPVYRIGGDEFLIILENSDYSGYKQLLERLDDELDAFKEDSTCYDSITIARGFASFEADRDLEYLDVFNRADKAMYRNKSIMKSFIALDAPENHDDESDIGADVQHSD